MPLRVGEAVVDLGLDMGPYERNLATAHKKTHSWLSSVSGVVKNALGYAFGVMAVNAVKKASQAVVGFVRDAAAVEGVGRTFDRLVQSVGGETVRAMQKLRSATRGMVSDADLMRASNRFLAMGLAQSTDEAAKLSEIATQLGSAMGEDATAAMENFALMLANQSIPRMDTYGMSAGRARERINELMEATEDMTREEAFKIAVMEQAEEVMAKVGEQGDTTAASMARLRARLRNLALAAGKQVLPILNMLLKPVAALVEKYAPKLQRVTEHLGKAMQDLFGGLMALVKERDLDAFLDKLHKGLFRIGTAIFGFSASDVRRIVLGVTGFIRRVNEAREWVANFWDTIRYVFRRGGWQSIFTFLKEFGLRIGRNLVESAKEGIGELRAKVGPWLANAWDALRGKPRELWGKLRDWLTEALPALGEKAGEWGAAMWGHVRSGWFWMREKAMGLWGHFRAWLNTGLPELAEGVATWGKNMWGNVQAAWETMKEKAPELWTNFVGWLGEMGEEVEESPLAGKVKQLVSDAWAALEEQAPALWQQFIAWLKETAVDVSEMLVNFTTAMREWAESDAAREKIAEVSKAITDWVIDQIIALFSDREKGESIIKALARNLGVAVTNLQAMFKAIGEGIADGIVDSIAGRFSDEKLQEMVADRLRGLFRAVVSVVLGPAYWTRLLTEEASKFFAGRRGRGFQGAPGYQFGTAFYPGGWGIVGERGPELVRLPIGSQISPQAGAFGGTHYWSVSVYAPNGTADEVRRGLREGILDVARARGGR